MNLALLNGQQHDEGQQPKKVVGPEDFEMLTVIGKGSFGKVVQVRHRGTSDVYAMKILKKDFLINSNSVACTIEERDALRRVHHPFIVQLLAAFQSRSKVYLVMEYVIGGELFSRLQSRQFFLPKEAQFYAAEAVLAIEYLHGIGIVHRDLKPENCLLDGQGHLRITDFGLAKDASRHRASDRTTTLQVSLSTSTSNVATIQDTGVCVEKASDDPDDINDGHNDAKDKFDMGSKCRSKSEVQNETTNAGNEAKNDFKHDESNATSVDGSRANDGVEGKNKSKNESKSNRVHNK